MFIIIKYCLKIPKTKYFHFVFVLACYESKSTDLNVRTQSILFKFIDISDTVNKSNEWYNYEFML